MLTALVLPIVASLLAMLTIGVFFVAIRGFSARDANVDQRIETYLGGGGGTQAAQNGPSFNYRLSNQLNEAIAKQSFASNIERDLALANVPLKVSEYLLVRIAIPLILAAVGLFIWRTVLVIPIALIAGVVVPSFYMGMRRRARNRLFGEQLAETLDLLTASMRGGLSLVQSLSYVANDAQEPTKTELRRVFEEIQLGRSITVALDSLVNRMQSGDLDLVVTAIKIHSRVGGNLTSILETISTTIRERAKLRREVLVLTSMQRISSYVIGALPFALGGIIFAINPAYMLRLFQPGWTLCIPIGAIISAVVGFLVIQKIADIKV